jgi:hypothetical protein
MACPRPLCNLAARAARVHDRVMWKLFNVVMRGVSTLVGLLMMFVGIVWILQGLNLAFRVGFMVGQPKWTVFGALLFLAGVGQVVWSNTRQKA